MYSILIVDDSGTTRSAIKRAITLAGIPAQLTEAADGNAALDMLKSAPADLVLVDVHMPGMGGIELMQRLQDDPATRDIPVLVVTAEPKESRLEELKRDGVRN